MKPITLKDIQKEYIFEIVKPIFDDVRKEAIKWVKDERERLHGDLPYDKWDALERWKTRLNITEEDLK